MSVPKELKREIASYEEDYYNFLKEGRDHESGPLNHRASMLESKLGMAGVRDPRRVMDASRDKAQSRLIEERRKAKLLKEAQQSV